MVFIEGGEVFRQGRRLVVADGGLGRGYHAGAHQFGLTLQFGENLAGRGFILAAGRYNLNDPGAVAVLGNVAEIPGECAREPSSSTDRR